jgi:hypothetical protein
MPHWTRRIALGATLFVAATGFCGPASAQTKLKWAHVYEVNEPYHTEAVWAAEEIKKRTNGKYEIGVFPASQLGNENQINEGLGLGTVDMIYTGVAFAGSIHKPIAITNAPFVLRDFDHFMAYRASPLFRDIAKGYEDKTKHKVVHQVGRCERDPDRVRRGVPRSAAGHGGRAGKSAADHPGEEILRGAVAHHFERPHHRVAAHHRREPCVAEAQRRREENL